MRQQFEDFQEKTQEEFDAFRKQQNERYAEFMRNNWERLDMLREKIPNIPFQMLLRGSNMVG